MAKDRANRTRKNELKIYLSDNEKYILDRKVELSKRKSASVSGSNVSSWLEREKIQSAGGGFGD